MESTKNEFILNLNIIKDMYQNNETAKKIHSTLTEAKKIQMSYPTFIKWFNKIVKNNSTDIKGEEDEEMVTIEIKSIVIKMSRATFIECIQKQKQLLNLSSNSDIKIESQSDTVSKEPVWVSTSKKKKRIFDPLEGKDIDSDKIL
ncbi:hypothetical protein CCZ01_09475 [Helicobacter monodelphidis]|uniref:hypothetical protein n=1 Tax=Helicobacter sp. 15-1451 TaxID=2004995 RepID=UPI000DCD2EA7|nr:hypothetical protein [Helicobacter sp. 15-1451]RAX56457.1 hypothetical protein CCZ01_09475 [Helicobacter sp. 15-1451]